MQLNGTCWIREDWRWYNTLDQIAIFFYQCSPFVRWMCKYTYKRCKLCRLCRKKVQFFLGKLIIFLVENSTLSVFLKLDLNQEFFEIVDQFFKFFKIFSKNAKIPPFKRNENILRENLLWAIREIFHCCLLYFRLLEMKRRADNIQHHMYTLCCICIPYLSNSNIRQIHSSGCWFLWYGWLKAQWTDTLYYVVYAYVIYVMCTKTEVLKSVSVFVLYVRMSVECCWSSWRWWWWCLHDDIEKEQKYKEETSKKAFQRRSQFIVQTQNTNCTYTKQFVNLYANHAGLKIANKIR